jgi:hypothetical protein
MHSAPFRKWYSQASSRSEIPSECSFSGFSRRMTPILLFEQINLCEPLRFFLFLCFARRDELFHAIRAISLPSLCAAFFAIHNFATIYLPCLNYTFCCVHKRPAKGGGFCMWRLHGDPPKTTYVPAPKALIIFYRAASCNREWHLFAGRASSSLTSSRTYLFWAEMRVHSICVRKAD